MEFPSQFVFIIWCKLGLAQLLFVFKSILRLQPSVCLLSVSISYMPNILQESSASFWSRPWSLELLYDQHCQRWWKALGCLTMHKCHYAVSVDADTAADDDHDHHHHHHHHHDNHDDDHHKHEGLRRRLAPLRCLIWCWYCCWWWSWPPPSSSR